jgi:leucyl aminopeptidase
MDCFMTDYSNIIQPDTGQVASALHIVSKAEFTDWLSNQPQSVRAMLAAQKCDGSVNDLASYPLAGEDGQSSVLVVEKREILTPWALAKAADALPEGIYRLEGAEAGDAMLGWLLAHYRFNEYRSEPKIKGPRILLTNEPGRIAAAIALAEATSLVRNLVNRPAGDLGPEALEQEVQRIAKAHKATTHELEWGDERHPRIAIIGKGVCFDSGGLDIKPAAGMRLMKKDMGGAAHAIALAELIMKAHLPVRLHLLIPAVENAISGGALRPGDIVKSRAGLHVEIDNTDAEGRLILADAMTKAVEDKAELMIDFATLTGAARTALGPDLPALFANVDDLAGVILDAADASGDPVWRLPLWKPYADMLDSDIADTMNSGGAFAGAITAALFLQKFVPDNIPWAHLDTYAWRGTAKPARPKGGEALGLRAIYRYLTETYPVR